MSQVRRWWFGMKMTVAMSFAAVIHFRVGVEQLYPMARTDFSGPYSPVIDTLEFIVPLAIVIILLATWAWVLYSPIQRERNVRTLRRP